MKLLQAISLKLLDFVLDFVGLIFIILPYLAFGLAVWYSYQKACLSSHGWLQALGWLVIVSLLLLVAPPVIRWISRQRQLMTVRQIRRKRQMLEEEAKIRLIDQDEW